MRGHFFDNSTPSLGFACADMVLMLRDRWYEIPSVILTRDISAMPNAGNNLPANSKRSAAVGWSG
jgi:hypothetical protein